MLMVTNMEFEYNDGGREAAGYTGKAGDCVTRAISIAAKLDYQMVYDELRQHSDEYSNTRRNKIAKSIAKKGSTPRNGVHKPIIREFLKQKGWEWHPTMRIGQGCTTHLLASELPSGRLIVSVSRHLVAVIDGVIHDTYDCSRFGTRCVYGYYTK